MISFPGKPKFYSHTLHNFLQQKLHFNKLKKRKVNLEKFRYRYSHTRYFKKEERRIKRTMLKIYRRFLKPEAVIKIYERNSCILFKVLYKRKIWVHRGGKDLIPITFRRYSVHDKKIGQFTRTKYMGKIIHVDNKISKKLAKKKKQIAAEVLQRRARKSKAKSKKKIKNKK